MQIDAIVWFFNVILLWLPALWLCFWNLFFAFIVFPSSSCQIGKQPEENLKRDTGLQPWGMNILK